MNILGLIFSILFALSIASAALFEKQVNALRVRSSLIGHMKANRKILTSFESKQYKDIPHVPRPRMSSPGQTQSRPSTKPAPFPEINPSCARLNIKPLIEEGRENHPLLYDTTLLLFKEFYGDQLIDCKKFEHTFFKTFLDALKRASSKEKGEIALEKLEFLNPEDRMLFYKMLKGTKKSNLFEKKGYPSLLDYLVVSPNKTEPCFKHAHPHLLSLFLGKKAALKLFQEIHKEKPETLTEKLIEKICMESHKLHFNRDIFELIDLGAKKCSQKGPSIFLGKDLDTKISLKKNISVKPA